MNTEMSTYGQTIFNNYWRHTNDPDLASELLTHLEQHGVTFEDIYNDPDKYRTPKNTPGFRNVDDYMLFVCDNCFPIVVAWNTAIEECGDEYIPETDDELFAYKLAEVALNWIMDDICVFKESNQ